MGLLRPYDPERFPEAEQRIASAWERWPPSGYEILQSFGFVDYFAGPHCRAQLQQVRQRDDYGSRPAAWWLFARSGDRAFGAFAEGTYLTYMDTYLTHADGPNKIAGIHLGATGLYDRFPFYWERSARVGSVPRPRDMLHLYYLTGNRRARDVVDQYAVGMRRWMDGGGDGQA